MRNILDFLNVRERVKHIHISDALPPTGEGLQIGEGVIDFERIVPEIFKLDVGIIPEVKGGHLNGGEGFGIARERILELNSKIF